jgi:hypothetical protein
MSHRHATQALTGTVVALLALVAPGCPVEDSDTGGSPGGGSATRDTGRQLDTGFEPGGGGNLSCNLESLLKLDSAGCSECLAEQCADDLESAFAVREIPSEADGACQDYLGCIDGCGCGATDCLDACLTDAGSACSLAIEGLESCQERLCPVACTDGPVDPGSCGNGALDDGEQCDGAAMAGDCTDFGFDGGSLACNEDCSVATEACFDEEVDCEEVEATLAPGDSVTGALSQESRLGGPRSPARFEVYAIELTVDQTVTITLESPDFDSYLYLADPDCETVASDDDSGPGGLDSQITYTAVDAGAHHIIVTSFSEGESGTYTLNVD